MEEECKGPFCLNCGSTNLYRDEDNDDLICGECNTQSQSLSQRETTEEENALGGTKIASGSVRKSAVQVLDEDKIEEDFRIPSLFECSEAFLSLVEMAARRSVSEDLITDLDGIDGFSNYRERIVDDAREIFLLFLERWDESANYFLAKFPNVRISLRDKFLTEHLRYYLTLQLNKSIESKLKNQLNVAGKGNRKDKIKIKLKPDSDDDNYSNSGDVGLCSSSSDSDNDEDNDREDVPHPRSKRRSHFSQLSSTRSPKKIRWDDSQNTLLFDSEESTIHSTTSARIGNNPGPYRLESPSSPNWAKELESKRADNIETWKALKDIIEKSATHGPLKDDSLYWKLGILDLRMDLNLATSIVYLAHLRSQTGVSSNHFIMWANTGKYPFLLDAYTCLEEKHRNNLRNLKSKWSQNRTDLVNPKVLDQIAIALLTCLVDPEEEEDHFLNELYRLNAERMKEKRLMQTSDRFLTKRHPKYKFIIAEEQVDESQEDKNPTQSPARSLQLGQYSQESEEGSTAFNTMRDIPAAFYNVGMMCNMFCAHLGVENRVLNFSYAIMGLPVYQNENNLGVNCNYHGDNEINSIGKDKRGFTFLPDALGLAKPCRLFSPLHVIAVIVVACKFCPGWDTWEVRVCQNNSDLDLNSSVSDHLDDEHCSDDTSTSSSLDVIISHKKKRNNAEQKRGVDHKEMPITKKEAVSSNELKSLYKIPNSNGERTLDYLDFITKSENKDFTSVDFKTSISSIPKTPLYRQKRKRAVSGNSVLKKEMDSRNAFKNRMFSECGLSEYLAYYRSASEFSTGVHRPYLTLISYIADRLCVKRKELHLLVMQFDEEIVCHAEKRKAFLSLKCFDHDPVYDLRGNLLTSSSSTA